jgi:hypothetical protein
LRDPVSEVDQHVETLIRSAIRKERPDALLILADRVFLHNRERMMDFTKKQRLPNVNALHKRAAIYVDKILKGAKPADLPIRVSLHSSSISKRHRAIAVARTRRPADRMRWHNVGF